MDNESPDFDSRVVAVDHPRLVVPLKCPFCDSDAEIDHDEMEQRAGIKASVRCLNLECRAFGPDGDNATEAVEKWNSRKHGTIERIAAKYPENATVEATRVLEK